MQDLLLLSLNRGVGALRNQRTLGPVEKGHRTEHRAAHMKVQDVLKEVLTKKNIIFEDHESNMSYWIGMLESDKVTASDKHESLVPVFEDEFSVDSATAQFLADEVILLLSGEATGEAGDEPKKLSAPVIMQKLESETSKNIRSQLTSDMPVHISYTPIVPLSQQEAIPVGMTAQELQQQMKAARNMVRTDRRGGAKEKRTAMMRDELIKLMTNKPIKLHPNQAEKGQSRVKDINLEQVDMTLGDLVLLEEITLRFVDGRKYGLIGANGMGKTTFLRFLSSHKFRGIPPGLQILHIEQEVMGSQTTVLDSVLECDVERDDLKKEEAAIQAFLSSEDHVVPEDDEFGLAGETSDSLNVRLGAIFDRLNEIDADSMPSRAAQILAGLGFTPEMQAMPTQHFSGGWRMRVSLAQALFIEPDILLLDEPTNHLDLHAVIWLEDYLTRWKSMLITVSHDRDFLNSVCTDIVHLYKKKLVPYRGNYNDYVKQKAERARQLKAASDANQKQRAHIQEYIDKNRVAAATAKMAQSRIKTLAKMADIKVDTYKDPTIVIQFPEPDHLPGFLTKLTDVSFAYPGEKQLFYDVHESIDLRTRVALVGPNGVGKSTFIKVMLGELQPTGGLVEINPKAKFGRFAQHHIDQLDLSKSPLQQMQMAFPTAKHQDLRKHLGGIGLPGNLALQPIYSLSGGQKSRVAFALITWLRPHVLVFDEPTNHLDMDTIDSLIEGLNSFDGGVFIVSHDEYLISTVCDQIWVVEDNQIRHFPGDFQDYKRYVSKRRTG